MEGNQSEMTDPNLEKLYQERLQRYVTAMRNGTPDRVPIRPFVAEFTSRYCGLTCQQVTHDYEMAFQAARRCAAEFDWDAVVGNMVYVWTGLTQALGLKYYAIPGLHVPAETGFQYLEPSESQAFMEPDEYDELIADPSRFLFTKWLPRASSEIGSPDDPASYRNNLALVKGGMAMWWYFMAFGTQNELLRKECGSVSAIAGILKAPMDIIADKLRGYLGLIDDLRERPHKVLEACRALIPHLLQVALMGADPNRQVPVTIWMHRGCVPFVSFKHFDEIYWPTLRPIIEALWSHGHQTLFYAEGNWNAHLQAFNDLPAGSIVYHVDRADIGEVHRALGKKFCISGGIPNTVLAFGNEAEVRDCCKRVIDEVAADGGYILDASAIIQNDAQVENVRAMTDFTREYGVYPSHSRNTNGNAIPPDRLDPVWEQMIRGSGNGVPAGMCIPWSEKIKELPPFPGDPILFERIWQDLEAFPYLFIWHCLLSF